ncbi:DEAD/DEAH box helicase [Bradyrhizobium sp. BRP19]|uniref:DEAD/DEAH box helicase n=1 Tax=Bradyrhizobium sp. BRP19 TaxID=2793823 RepID=UPI001CD6A7B0|nr:DEAD/DEAH box helicase [Bradyrhizobium sp. BRP19]MCA1549696.1 DEAD/DEAH box helicase [Bradyrhizobium sp. BRP19]
MFGPSDLTPCITQPWFQDGYRQLERNLLLVRLGLEREPLSRQQRAKLKRFSQAVIGSASSWESPREGAARLLCQLAGDIEASLAVSGETEHEQAHLALFKAVVLYDLAGLPGASASFVARNGFDPRIREFFSRAPQSLWGSMVLNPEEAQSRLQSEPAIGSAWNSTFEQAIADVVQEAAIRLQRGNSEGLSEYFDTLTTIAGHYSIGLTGDDLKAIARLVELRETNSSLNVVRNLSPLDAPNMRAIGLPLELWPAQVRALDEGLLDQNISSFGFAAPTGTGKTALTKLLIADAVAKNPQWKVLYICPSRALVHQVSEDLQTSLGGVGLKVLKAGAHLVAHDRMPISSDEADVIVFTPERADLLLRIDPAFLKRVCLVVVDEAHHIEQGPRGVLLEFYLWRLRKMVSNSARIVQLSAVAPNIADLTDWISLNGASHSVMLDWRTSKLRVGVLERTARGGAILDFSSVPYTLLPDGALPINQRRGLAVLANHLSKSGIVLVLCSSPAAAEEVASYVAELRSEIQDVKDDVSERLDAWIERELYPESELRGYYQKRVVFHHAQMPPRVRQGLEEAIRGRKVDVICATTTLAEGVNFPFSTVVVETLASKKFELSPRALWNIAGRAGRFGVDSEGHCILFRPSLWVDGLTEYRLEDYMKADLADIPPVRSALALGIERLDRLIGEGKIDFASLEDVSLAAIKVDNRATEEAKAIRALINIVRVGYAHANSSGLVSVNKQEAPEFTNELLASRQLPESTMKFATALGEQQRRVVSRATAGDPEFIEVAARVGWSLEAQHILYSWLRTRQNWQLEQFGSIVVGGYVRNFERLGYLIGPVAKHLIAFEGAALGGAIAFLAEKWIRGIPLSNFQSERGASFGRMVSNVYGRMQYLLPWGLFGMHELLQYEARLRSITVGDGLSALSVLAAEGVSNFNALQLVLDLGMERVDATRLAERYKREKVLADISDWFVSKNWSEIERVVRGADNRRVDPSLRALHRRLRESSSAAPSN